VVEACDVEFHLARSGRSPVCETQVSVEKSKT
jgi:hypothetical protein